MGFAMPCSIIRNAVSAILLLLLGVVGPDVNAAPSKSELRTEQAGLFDAMLADPQNLETMFAYAAVSARLEDYEAAISTLERMLIFNRDLPRVRLELGALYYRIGAYSVAERYFQSVAALPDLPQPVAARIDGYLARIARRTQTHRFSGRIEAGVIADTNANRAPDSRDVLLFGQLAELTRDSVEEDDVGGRLRADLTHRYDLGTDRNDFWRTDLSYLGRRYAEENSGNLDAFIVRTGPSLSLDSFAFGPKLRPFVDGEYVRADNQSLYRGIGAGVQYRQTPGDEWSIFGELRGGYRDYTSRDDEDGAVGLARVGIGWLPGRDTVVTLSLTGQRDQAEEDFNRNTEGVLRLSGSFAYDPGVGFAGDKWVISGYASAGLRHFDDGDPVISRGTAREDREFRLGASHVFNFKSGFYGTVGVDALWRDSNLPNFDLDNVGASASVGYRF